MVASRTASGSAANPSSNEPPQDPTSGSAVETSSGNVTADRWIVFFALAVLGGALDLWTKQQMFAWRGLPGQRDVFWVIEGYFGIQTAVNTGAVFGMGAGKGTFFAIVSVVAAIGVFLWLFVYGAARSKWLTVAMGLITGGIIGNLYDRLGLWWQVGYPEAWRSGVRDWILWQASDELRWPNFNIADSLLVTGAIMLMIHSFLMSPLDRSADQQDESQPGSDSEQSAASQVETKRSAAADASQIQRSQGRAGRVGQMGRAGQMGREGQMAREGQFAREGQGRRKSHHTRGKRAPWSTA